MHPNCRSTFRIIIPNEWEGWTEEEIRKLEKEGWSKDEVDKALTSWRKTRGQEKSRERLTYQNKSGIIKESGAVYYRRNQDDINFDRYRSKQEIADIKHAYHYYNAVRNRDSKVEIAKIYKNISVAMGDFSKQDVSKAYKHVFENKYQLAKGYTYFDPDPDMAKSWQRLREGKNIKSHDFIMLRHERLEYDYMNIDGMGYLEAHEKANKKYNYLKELKRGE